jgi:hypothetical protein
LDYQLVKSKVCLFPEINVNRENCGVYTINFEAKLKKNIFTPSVKTLFIMKSCILSLVFFLFTLGVIAQGIVVDSLGVAVNENELSADPSAILDVSSQTKGVLIPRLTDTEIQAIQNPAEGLLVFSTTDQVFKYYQNSNWNVFAKLSDIPVDGDSNSSNELITDFSVDQTNRKLNIIEGGQSQVINIDEISPWIFDKLDFELYPIKSEINVAIGANTVRDMDNLGGPFISQTPRVDICTGVGDDIGFTDVFSMYRAKCGSKDVTRRIGYNLSLRRDFEDDYKIDGGLFLESKKAYGEAPSLKIFLNNHNAINIVPNKFPWVGIHTDNPQCEFFVNGDAGGTSAWHQFSDSLLKENVQTIDSALTIIESLRGVYFDWRSDSVFTRPEGRQVGFIAQELQPYLPEVVNDTSEYSPYFTVSYASITPVLAQAIKELKAQKDSEVQILNEDLEAKETEIEALQTELQELRNTVEALQTAVEAMQENN